MIRKLEKRKLLIREKNPFDKRRYSIALTVKGRIEANKIGDPKPIILEALTEEEKIIFNDLLIKLNTDIPQILKRKPRRHNIDIRNM